MSKSKPNYGYRNVAMLLMLTDPPGTDLGIIAATLWMSPVIFLLVITGMFLLLHLGLASPAKRMLNGWLIILLPLLAVIYSFVCRPVLANFTGKPLEGIWWLIVLYPSLVVSYWLVFRYYFGKRVGKQSHLPLED